MWEKYTVEVMEVVTVEVEVMEKVELDNFPCWEMVRRRKGFIKVRI